MSFFNLFAIFVYQKKADVKLYCAKCSWKCQFFHPLWRCLCAGSCTLWNEGNKLTCVAAVHSLSTTFRRSLAKYNFVAWWHSKLISNNIQPHSNGLCFYIAFLFNIISNCIHTNSLCSQMSFTVVSSSSFLIKYHLTWDALMISSSRFKPCNEFCAWCSGSTFLFCS